jgi:hypothetical protein
MLVSMVVLGTLVHARMLPVMDIWRFSNLLMSMVVSGTGGLAQVLPKVDILTFSNLICSCERL